MNPTTESLTTHITRSKTFSIALKAGLVSLLVLAFLPFAARAQGCARWDVSGKWKIKNAGGIVNVDIKSTGKYYSAIANYEGIGGEGIDKNVVVNGDKLGLFLIWDLRDNATQTHNENYFGYIGSDGKVSGVARVFGYLSKDTPFTFDRPMVCAEKSRFNPVHKLGVKPSTPNPPAPPPPAPAANAPMIAAAPTDVILRRPQTQGTTTLIWDGGKDHPYAEVWLKIDNQDETFVLEKGKGTLPVTVLPGRTYLYILTDNGVRLATVAVRAYQQ